MDTQEQITSNIEEISKKLNLVQKLLRDKSPSPRPGCKFICKNENYSKIISRLNKILSSLNKGIEHEYCIPYPKLPDTLHWEITNEFLQYFLKNNSVEEIKIEKAPGNRFRVIADLFFIANGGNYYWVEVQTTLNNQVIENKLKQAISCSGREIWTEYVLIFPKEFEKKSLFKSTILKVTGKTETDKLRIMLYDDGEFETVVPPGKRNVKKGSDAELFGRCL